MQILLSSADSPADQCLSWLFLTSSANAAGLCLSWLDGLLLRACAVLGQAALLVLFISFPPHRTASRRGVSFCLLIAYAENTPIQTETARTPNLLASSPPFLPTPLSIPSLRLGGIWAGLCLLLSTHRPSPAALRLPALACTIASGLVSAIAFAPQLVTTCSTAGRGSLSYATYAAQAVVGVLVVGVTPSTICTLWSCGEHSWSLSLATAPLVGVVMQLGVLVLGGYFCWRRRRTAHLVSARLLHLNSALVQPEAEPACGVDRLTEEAYA